MFVKEVTVGRPPVHLRMELVARSTCHVTKSTYTHNSVRIPALFSSVARILAMLDSWWPCLGDPLSPACGGGSCELLSLREVAVTGEACGEGGSSTFPPKPSLTYRRVRLDGHCEGASSAFGVSGSWGAQNQLQLFRARGGSPRRFPWFVFSIFHLFVCVFGT